MPPSYYLYMFIGLAFAHDAWAFELDLNAVRFTLSKPETSHSLTYKPTEVPSQKIRYDLTPLNNERFGVFLDVNGIEIGYAFDIFKDGQETKTQDLIFSYARLPQSKITLNYQVLEGFHTEAQSLTRSTNESQFLSESRSTKVELFGLHNFYTLIGKSLLCFFKYCWGLVL